MLWAATPCLRLNQLRPPLTQKPVTDGSELLPARPVRPYSLVTAQQLAPLDAGADAGDALVGVDVDRLHRAGAQHDRAVGGERCAVADRLGRDGHAVLDRVADGGDDVLRILNVDDGERALVDGDGEAVPVGVVVGIGREGYLAGQRLGETGEDVGGGKREGHDECSWTSGITLCDHRFVPERGRQRGG